MADRLPLCAIVIPTYGGAALTADCLRTLRVNPPSRCRQRIVVVDDASPEDMRAGLAEFAADIQLVRQEHNTGFAGACNAGAAVAGDCDHLVFLNNDTLPAPGWLDALVDEVERDDEVAAVGAKLLYANGQVQHAGVVIHRNGLPYHLYAGFDGGHPAVNHARDLNAVTAACVLVRRADFEALGGFDAAYRNAYEDIDFCLRLRERGRRIRYTPASVVVHLESVTRFPQGLSAGTAISERRYEERWRGRVVPDDVERYLEDGLLTVDWGPYCPLTVSVSPDLAVIRRDGEELAYIEQLLDRRSRQVIELLTAHTRRELSDRAAPPRPTLSTTPPTEAVQVLRGTEHHLGGGAGARLVSVLIPVKNGARHLEQTLPAVLEQSVSARVEIIAVDSGSTDDTLAVLERFGATAWTIPSTDFDHGLTRNLLACHARGDVLVFLTQLARPANEGWLEALLAAVDGDPRVVGACSRLVPRPDADPLTRRDVERDLSGATDRQLKQIDDWSVYERMAPEERRRFLNFHTVSTAIRSEALQRTPFRAVRTLGEDLLWAREVIETGWALVHEPASVAHHSHPYTLDELFGRNVDDGVANRDIVDRSVGRWEIEPRIQGQVREDWAYLRDELGLSGAELERWQIDSVLRRVAQTAGQWLGVNYETLPDGAAAYFSNVARTRDGGAPPGAGGR
jgi:GT2 family glycosyltransferase